MIRFSIFIVLIFLLTTTFLYAESFTGKCISVSSGDTLNVTHNGRESVIKLEGADCPEEGQDYFNEAKDYTADLVLNKEVWIDVKRAGYDKKLIAIVKCDNKELNLELVKNGLAWYDYRLMKNRELCDAEKTARDNKQGLWAGSNPIEPWNFKRSSSGIVPIGLSSTELRSKKSSSSSGSGRSGDFGFVPAVGKCESSFKISTVPNYNNNSSSSSGSSSGGKQISQNGQQGQSSSQQTSSSTITITSTSSGVSMSSRRNEDKSTSARTSQQGTDMCYVCMKQCPKDKLIWFNGININVCSNCITEDIDNSGFVQLLYQKVRETMERDWNMTGAGIPNLDVEHLKKNTLGQYSIKWREIKIDRAQNIIITLAVISHEFAHAWQQANYPQIDDLTYIEGFATWIQYKFVEYMGYKKAAEVIVAMTPELYRYGFQYFRGAERNYSFPSGIREHLATLEKEGK